jgi:anti-sigma factor RsiW
VWRDEGFFMQRKQEMKCEEFESIGLDAARDSSLSEAERAAAREHAATCSHCAALQDSWQAAGVELRAFAEDTAMAQAPARVEMRLLQEFRTQHVTLRVRRGAIIAAWALATAAVLVGAVSWRNWRHGHLEETKSHLNPAPAANNVAQNNSAEAANNKASAEAPNAMRRPGLEGAGSSDTLVADNELRGFTFLPGAFTADADDAEILRVRMQRGALGALGLPVNEERASEWIQVDLLVGDDGLPQAVRLPQ